MKKLIALLLSLLMLCTLTLSAFAEAAEDVDALKEAEMEAMMEWLSEQIPEEEIEESLTWDRDTILEKLEGYDQELRYITKEEAADELAAVLSLFSMFEGVSEDDDGGEAAMALLDGLFGMATDDADDGDGADAILGLLGGLFSSADDGNSDGADAVKGLFGGLLGSDANGEGGADAITGILGGLLGGENGEINTDAITGILGGLLGGENGEINEEAITGLLGSLLGTDENGEINTDAITGLIAGLFGADEGSEGGADAVRGLLGGLLGGDDGEGGSEGLGDLLGLLSLFSSGDTDWDDEDESYEIMTIFDGTFFESGETRLESWFQDGYYKVLVHEGETELVYLCAYDEFAEDEIMKLRLTGIGTGDDELTEIQPDHGQGEFVYHPFEETLTWKRTDGTEVVFTQIIDPLNGQQYFFGANTLLITWLGDLNYQVDIVNNVDYAAWGYQCVLDEDTDVLSGTGWKSDFMDEIFTDDHATFAFQNGRNQLVFTSVKEETAQSGWTMEHIENDLINAFWSSEDGYWASMMWLNGYYWVMVYGPDDISVNYLCSYDRETSTFVAVDITNLNLEEDLGLYMEKEQFSISGTLALTDDTHLVWQDAQLTPDDGIVLENF
ncbi:MAG: hypothetical protein IJ083_10775 [Clostridia bacterium]|nr:hypothetical protein [Clostridia bacterium]